MGFVVESVSSCPEAPGRFAQTFGNTTKLLPDYSINIVVAVVTNRRMRWFVSEKEDWFLDAVAFAAAFSEEPSQQARQIVKAL